MTNSLTCRVKSALNAHSSFIELFIVIFQEISIFAPLLRFFVFCLFVCFLFLFCFVLFYFLFYFILFFIGVITHALVVSQITSTDFNDVGLCRGPRLFQALRWQGRQKLEKNHKNKTRGIWGKGGGFASSLPIPTRFSRSFSRFALSHYLGTWNRLPRSICVNKNR